MSNPKRYTITSALPYTNGPVHIGQLAGAYVPADIYVRYLRMRYGADNVVYICGSDEHGAAITMKGIKEGVSPQQIVDKYNAIIKESFEKFGISFDIYHRTSSQLHHETAAEFFSDLYKKGAFIEKETEQYYDLEQEQFLADRYIKGTCPNCQNENAYGDQCEKCGTSLDPTELINPKSTITGSTPELRKTKQLFLSLDTMQPWLEDWIIQGNGRPEKWKRNVLGACKSWLTMGLQPRSMTRDLKWGIPVPVEGYEGKVLYVWFDAPIGYISATKQWAKDKGVDWKPYWQDKEGTKLVHFLGKDNIVFHCITFPAILKSHGDYVIPRNVPANEFMNMEGDKMSTSRNWTVWLHEYLEEFPGKQDVLRYVLTANMPETKDSEFTWKDFQQRNNSELAKGLGNFVNRVVVLTHKYYDGVVPSGTAGEMENELLSSVSKDLERITNHLENYEFRMALTAMMDVMRSGDKYLAETEPWKLIKTDAERTATVMNTALQVVGHLSILMKAFLPFSADKLQGILNIDQSEWKLEADTSLLPVGHKINAAEMLFTMMDDEHIAPQLAKLDAIRREKEATAAAALAAGAAASVAVSETIEKEYVPLKDQINYEDFAKLDIRVGTILSAAKVPKADKLLEIQIDLGFEQRTVVSGIAEHYAAEEIVGQQVCVLANLAPRKLRGIVSNGMILMADNGDGLSFLSPATLTGNGEVIS